MRACALVAACAILIAGCDSSPARPSPATCTFSLSSTSLSVSAAGGTGSVAVSTAGTCAWEARSNVPWITAASGTALRGPGTFTFTVAAAPDSGTRAGTLTVASQTVTVTQQGQACACVLSPAGASFGAAGGVSSFMVAAPGGCAWTATASAAWLMVTSGASGSGGGTVAFSVATNAGAASRTASIAVADQSFAVTQAGLSDCTATLSANDEIFPAAGGAGTFQVTAASSCDWMAVANVAWITLTDPAGGFGTGSRRVSYSVAANNGDAGRTGTVTVGSRRFAVTQAGAKPCTYSVSPVEYRECFRGAHDVKVTIAADIACPWTAASAVSWLQIISGATGYGSGSITFNIASNPDPPRQGNIEVRWPAPTAGQNVRVKQSGCSYYVGVKDFGAPAAGGDFRTWVLASSDNPACEGPLQDGCRWTAVSSAPWVTFPGGATHGGVETLVIRVASNPTGDWRRATVTVVDQIIKILQGPT